ncbi:MAG: hypothetical protein IRY99_25020, partial [Isosphaeraceae bacterium]|nr:hypothetical protein [Isosphaeraceae bacterium]
VKIFPAVVAGPAFVQEVRALRRSRLLGTLALVLTIAVGTASWVALARGGVIDSMGYHVGRGLEIGSTYSGIVMAAAQITGTEIRADYVHKAAEVMAPGAAWAARLALPVQAAALLFVMWRSWRAGPAELPRYAAASILAFIVTGKVLSPQYVMWVLPLVAVIEGRTGRKARWLYLVVCLATTAVYPWSFMGLMHLEPLAAVILNLRNALLVALLMWLLLAREA